MSFAQTQVADPTVRADVAAHAATNAVLAAIVKEMFRLGFADGGGVDEDRRFRNLVYLTVLPRIDRKRNPMVSAAVAAIGRAPDPTRAQALIASGLLDMARDIDDLAASLSAAVVNALGGAVSHALVRSAIRQGLIDLFNGQTDGLDDIPAAKTADQILVEIRDERHARRGEAR